MTVILLVRGAHDGRGVHHEGRGVHYVGRGAHHDDRGVHYDGRGAHHDGRGVRYDVNRDAHHDGRGVHYDDRGAHHEFPSLLLLLLQNPEAAKAPRHSKAPIYPMHLAARTDPAVKIAN